MARLQSEFCTKEFFLSYEFSYEKCSDISPESVEPFFCGSENPAKFPTKFPKFPCEQSKKIADELLQERRENNVVHHGNHALGTKCQKLANRHFANGYFENP